MTEEKDIKKLIRREIKRQMEASASAEGAKEKPLDLMTAKEAGDFLRVSNKVIYNLMKTGALTYYVIRGSHVKRYKRADVEALLHKIDNNIHGEIFV